MTVGFGLGRRPLWVALALAAGLGACATRATDPPEPVAPPLATSAPEAPVPVPTDVPPATLHGARGDVVGRNERLLVYRPVSGDTLEGVATRFLGDADKSWMIEQANPGDRLQPGQAVLVPLRPLYALGVTPDGVQTVPILCYHRLGSGTSKMVIAPSSFEQQMLWLVRNGYRVVRLADVAEHLDGRQALPPRAVVITFDDGYESVYRHAFPVLRRLRLPATAFVYTDFLGGGDALTWPQMQEMQASGLVDIQSHSKSHRNLTERRPGETEERYRANIDLEMRSPRDILERRLPPLKVRHLAYPFGDANDLVVDSAKRNGVELAVTVVPGGNPFFAHPLMLRRSMIFGDTSLDAFKAKLAVHRPLAAP